MTFEEAFREINGRAPTVEETKRALAIRRVVKDAERDLDPILLFFLADANAAAERERIPGALKAAVDEGVARLRSAIPASGELARAMGDVRAVTTTFDRLNEVMSALSRWIIVAATFALALLALGGFGGYRLGWNAGEAYGYAPVAREVCASLANVRHDLRTHRAQFEALDRERVSRGC